MNIKNNHSQINFQAKFLQTESIYEITEYAVKNGKFNELNKARKIFEKADPRTRVAVDICYTGKKPTLIFSYYVPNPARSGMFSDEFILVNQTDFIAKREKEHPLKFALKLIINIAKQGEKSSQFKTIFSHANSKKSSIWI